MPKPKYSPMRSLEEGGKTRVAIYARYSSDMQRPTSIEDQIRQCREKAAAKGWEVLDEHIYIDEAVTGQTLIGRENGLDKLSEAAKQYPPAFDGVVLDDTSRLGRHVPGTLNTTEQLAYSGVFLYFSTLDLDTRATSARTIQTFCALMDEQYSKSLSDKVHRGQRGRFLAKCNPSGRCYGYTNVPILHPTKMAEHGRPAVMEVRQKINEEEAAIVRQIFEMYAAGVSYRNIAKRLNAVGAPSPQAPRSRTVRGWHMSAIRDLIFNQKYIGVVIWNRHQTFRNPYTGKREQKLRPEKDWERIENPDLRIVSDELWAKAHDQNKRMTAKHGPKRLGGMNRAQRVYLFSGILECGLCGTNITIVANQGKYARYGCPHHRFDGLCNNGNRIVYHKLESQLIDAIRANLTNPQMKASICKYFEEQLRNLVQAEQSYLQMEGGQRSELLSERSRLQKQADNITSAIAEHGISDLLSLQLRVVEPKLKAVISRLEAPAPSAEFNFSRKEIEEFVEQEARDFSDALTADRSGARQEIQKRIQKLVLMPSEKEGVIFDVSGDVQLFVAPSDGMQSNSLERFAQQYSHCFSLAGLQLVIH